LCVCVTWERGKREKLEKEIKLIKNLGERKLHEMRYGG
jgi:hypothetical protein